MWGDAMKAIEGKLPDEDFAQPSGTDVQGVQQTVPDVGGLSVEAARSQLEALGFGVSISGLRAFGVPRRHRRLHLPRRRRVARQR